MCLIACKDHAFETSSSSLKFWLAMRGLLKMWSTSGHIKCNSTSMESQDNESSPGCMIMYWWYLSIEYIVLYIDVETIVIAAKFGQHVRWLVDNLPLYKENITSTKKSSKTSTYEYSARCLKWVHKRNSLQICIGSSSIKSLGKSPQNKNNDITETSSLNHEIYLVLIVHKYFESVLIILNDFNLLIVK